MKNIDNQEEYKLFRGNVDLRVSMIKRKIFDFMQQLDDTMQLDGTLQNPKIKNNDS